MWLIPTKRQIKKEFKKIANSFQKRDTRINKNSNKLNNLKSQLEITNLKIAKLEGALSVILQKNTLSQSPKVLTIPPKSQTIPLNIETKLINRVRRSKKALVMSEIAKLSPSLSVVEMYEDIVLEKGLCSKASFYRYVASLKSQSLIKTEIKTETN